MYKYGYKYCPMATFVVLWCATIRLRDSLFQKLILYIKKSYDSIHTSDLVCKANNDGSVRLIDSSSKGQYRFLDTLLS